MNVSRFGCVGGKVCLSPPIYSTKIFAQRPHKQPVIRNFGLSHTACKEADLRPRPRLGTAVVYVQFFIEMFTVVRSLQRHQLGGCYSSGIYPTVAVVVHTASLIAVTPAGGPITH